ncbi:SMI1/KNR4 family protein [Undibacterium sp. Di24W]|uniref:SMI1/KNR4 family protein n=1 Tax=Undibacterium sp. Di24W TaxID=3413033 RepID=UPI003BF3FCEB
MFSPDRTWFRNPGASNDALQSLRVVAGVNLPVEYFELLEYSNGGEGSLPISPFNLCLDSAEDATNNKVEKIYEEFFPGFFVFGGSGGGDFIAFDLRSSEPWPIVAIDMTNINLAESVDLIAKDFPTFLALIGVEKKDV